ncbi:hypothetical protein Mapa_002683 [Marchantia paleacea]|nr:hypothetical protein Mapa_002683 [Marchantia paleacea]
MIRMIVGTGCCTHARVFKLEYVILLAMACACWLFVDVSASRARLGNEFLSGSNFEDNSRENKDAVIDTSSESMPETDPAKLDHQSLRSSQILSTPYHPPLADHRMPQAYLLFSKKSSYPPSDSSPPSTGN